MSALSWPRHDETEEESRDDRAVRGSNQPVCPCCGGEVSPLDLILDDVKGWVLFNGAAARLTPKQMRLFRALMDRYPAIVTKVELLNAMSGTDNPDHQPEIKIVDVVICKVRAALGELDLVITTTWGVGYALELNGTGKAAALRAKRFGDSRRRKVRSDIGDLATIRMLRERGFPLTDIARRTNLTFRAVADAIDMLESEHAKRLLKCDPVSRGGGRRD